MAKLTLKEEKTKPTRGTWMGEGYMARVSADGRHAMRMGGKRALRRSRRREAVVFGATRSRARLHGAATASVAWRSRHVETMA